MRIVDHEMGFPVESLFPQKNNVLKYLDDFHYILTDSGRSAIRMLSHHLPEGDVLVPYFSCSSVFRSLSSKKNRIVYYRVNHDFSVDLDDLDHKITDETKVIYLIHSFGKTQPKYVLEHCKKLRDDYGLLIIEDTTHSIFSNPLTIGDYAVSSLRKWMPIPDGGVLYSRKDLSEFQEEKLEKGGTPERLMSLTLCELFHKGEITDRGLVEQYFAKQEMQLDEYEQSGEYFGMSDLTRFLCTCFDVSVLCRKRKENLRLLTEKIRDLPFLKLAIPDFPEEDCPYDLPVYLEDRDRFCEYLRGNGIYPWRIWRTYETPELQGYEESLEMGRHIVNLPIDQYHSTEDMMYVADVIRAFR